jgi:hypothetical protein
VYLFSILEPFAALLSQLKIKIKQPKEKNCIKIIRIQLAIPNNMQSQEMVYLKILIWGES